MSSPAPPFKRMYDDVRMHIPALTDAVFKQMLYHVTNDFLSMTNIWTEEIPVAVQPGVTTYPLPVSHLGEIKRLMLVYDVAQSGADKHWVHGGVQMTKPGVLNVHFTPAAEASWMAVVAKTLDTVGSQGYPEIEASDRWIVDQYGDGIIYGILGRLMGMPSKPFTNQKLAKDYWQVYVTERGKARTDVLKANTYDGQRWLFPQAFATVNRKNWA